MLGYAATVKKDLFIVEGMNHYDLYDKPEAVDLAAKKLIAYIEIICNKQPSSADMTEGSLLFVSLITMEQLFSISVLCRF